MKRHLIKAARSNKKVVKLTVKHLKSAKLEDVFALIHMHQDGYSIRFRFDISDYFEVEIDADSELDIYPNMIDFRWPYDNIEIPLMIMLVQNPDIIASKIHIFEDWGDVGAKYVCPISDKIIRMAIDTQTIHYWTTRSMMRNLGIEYPENGSEFSKSFFDDYIGAVPTKKAETAPKYLSWATDKKYIFY